MNSISIASPDLGEEEQRRVVEVIEDGHVADGPLVRQFESEFAQYCGADHAVGTSNGTTALHTAFEALGIGEGDRVVTTPFSFIASANAIRFAGAEPVFVDVDPETYNLDPHAVEEAARERDVDAVLAVHLYGLPAAMDHLRDVADDHDLALIEDAAQAHGAEYDGQPVGSLGDAACFSFYPTKNMTTGEGGMITTDREEVAERAARFINHGRTETYEHAEVGHNFRMTSIAAAIGRAQLTKLPDNVDARRSNAATLTDAIEGVASVTAPTEPAGREHAYHQYTVRCEDRDALRAHLDERGIGVGVYYPLPIHEQPAYADVSASAPEAERAADEVLSLPVHQDLDEDDLRRMTDSIHTYNHD